MAQGDSPTVARRRVRLAIREAREAAKITQAQVAEEMEWSLSKVIRIENGEVSISVNDLKPLLGYIGVKDRAVVAGLLADARLARARQRNLWHQAPEFREHLSEVLRSLIEYEAKAVEIRYFSIYFFPGPLQIPAYSAALLELFGEEIPEPRRNALLKARQLRHKALVDRISEVKLYVLLDESVLRRTLGGPVVLADQLRELLRVAAAKLVRVRMVPFSQEAPLTNNASFDLLSLNAQDEDEMVLYYENGMTDALDEVKATTSRHRSRFDKVWADAASEEDTIDFISGRIKDLEAIISSRRGNTQ